MAPMRQASDFTTGVEIQTTTSASANARKASRRSGIRRVPVGLLLDSRRSAILRLHTVALEPQGEGEQAPELAAEILAPGDVRVDERGHRQWAEEPLARERLGRQHLARKRLEVTPQP